MSGLDYDSTFPSASNTFCLIRNDCSTRDFIAIEPQSLATFFKWSEDHNRDGNAEHHWQHQERRVRFNLGGQYSK